MDLLLNVISLLPYLCQTEDESKCPGCLHTSHDRSMPLAIAWLTLRAEQGNLMVANVSYIEQH